MSALSRRAARVAAVLLCAGVLAGCAAPAGVTDLSRVHGAGPQPPQPRRP